MIKTFKSIQYFSDLDGKQLFELPEEGEERLGAIIEFNGNYGGICDGEQTQFVIPEWLAKEFFERIMRIKYP